MKTQVAKSWNDKAQIYSDMAFSKELDSYEYEINFPSILRLLPKKTSSVLDLGCGNGVFTQKLAELYSNVLGTDVSPNMIDICRKQYPDLNFEVLDLESKFNIKDKFDLVTCKLVLMFVENLENVAVECFKILKSGGYISISVYHPTHMLIHYLQDKYKIKDRPEFRVLKDGYFSKDTVHRSIGGDSNLVFGYKFRNLSEYLNTFIDAGFTIERIDEPRLTKEYMNKYPQDNDKSDIPMRLNVLFKKT